MTKKFDCLQATKDWAINYLMWRLQPSPIMESIVPQMVPPVFDDTDTVMFHIEGQDTLAHLNTRRRISWACQNWKDIDYLVYIEGMQQ